MAFLRFMLRRLRQHWQILLTLSLGVVLTTALLASGPLLLDAVIEMGLRLTFQSASVADGNLRLTTSAPVDRSGFEALDAEIRALLQADLGDYLDRVTWLTESAWLFPWIDGQLASDQRLNLRAYEGAEYGVEYIAGGWPAEASSEPHVIRALVGDGMARAYSLRVGDRLPLSLEPDSPEPDIWIEVVGIAHPQDPRDPYWFGEFSPLTFQSDERWSAQYGVIVPADAFFPTVASLFPEAPVALAWHALLNHDALSIADIQPFQTELAGLEARLDAYQPRVSLATGVPHILTSFQQQLESIRIPLYILIAEVMLLLLFYVTMVAALSMGQVEREFAILRSRGASGWQIVRIQLAEALVILVVGFVSGPWLGAALVRTLSYVGPLADIGQAAQGLSPSQSAWLAAGVGTLACMAGLLLPLGPALRRSIVTHGQMVARSTRPPWWQRLYLDVFVLVGGLVLLWRLRLYGEMITGGPGGARLDWLLLLSPVAFLLGAAAILLRVFPLILQAMASLVARGRGLTGALALWQASRNPTHVARLVLLLTLAIALGVLSTGLNITLDQSEYDRAYYLAGNDLRLISQRAVPLIDLQSAPGVVQLSGVWRGEGAADLGPAVMDPMEVAGSQEVDHPRFEVLAIEPDSFSDVTTYRHDFADEDMDELLNQLAIPEGQHPALLQLPGQPASFGLWLWGMPEDKAELDSYHRWIDGDSDAERLGLVAKLQTAQGELFTARLRRPETSLQTDRVTFKMDVGGRDFGLRVRIKPDNQGWNYFEGPLPVLPASSYPVSLHSLWFENRATRLGQPIAKGISVVLDNLTVVDAATQERQVVEDFESLTRTKFLNKMASDSIWVGLFTRAVSSEFAGEPGSGQLVSMSFIEPGQVYPLRVRQTWTPGPLPALASPAFLETTKLQPGDIVRAWVGDPEQIEGQGDVVRRSGAEDHLRDLAEIDFRIVGALRHFPTMYGELEAGFLVTSRDLLLAVLNDSTQLSTNPNEAFVQTDGSTSLDILSPMVPQLSQSWEAESVRKALKANPLALGLRGVTFFASMLMVVLSLVGFATHFYLSVRQREMLYGVMRAMGMSARELYSSIVIEQAVLILAGLALGTGLGVLLNQITLPRLPVSLGERQPIPPFVPREDWLAVAALYLLLAVAFLVILGIVTALLRRARIDRVLRIGQE